MKSKILHFLMEIIVCSLILAAAAAFAYFAYRFLFVDYSGVIEEFFSRFI